MTTNSSTRHGQRTDPGAERADRLRGSRALDHKPSVAAIVTAWYPNSHADVIVRKILEGFVFKGEHVESRLELASLYLDQRPWDDVGAALAVDHGVPIFDTVGEAVSLGKPGTNVDGVLITGEHGDYPVNDRNQKMYPRRRLFDATIATMIGSGRTVPVFVDKHLSWAFPDAFHMWSDARRLGIPLLAGSTVPLAWRSPPVDWPLRGPMHEAVVVSHGGLEVYEFHAFEGLQCMAERRLGGESGVASVRDIPASQLMAARGTGMWDERLEWAALGAIGLSGAPLRRALASCSHAIQVEYRSGLGATILRYEEGVRTFGFAGSLAERGGGLDDVIACAFTLEPRPPHGHFGLLLRQIESLVLTGAAPYPVERTLLTTGVLDAAMRSRAYGGVVVPTPELAISYEPVDEIPDTAIAIEPPFTLDR